MSSLHEVEGWEALSTAGENASIGLVDMQNF